VSAKRLLLPLTLITLAGAALRFYQLNSIPAGLHYDIAANATLVEDIALRGYRPVFISAYTGKEVLFFYSAAALFRLIGSSVFSLRATAAFWGVLTIPITFFALRQLLHHQRHSRWLAAFGAAMLAFSFAHLAWSRFGLRAITQPAVQAMAVGFIFRALRARRQRDFWLAGLFTGMSVHTYLAARVLPLALAVGALPLLRARSCLASCWRPVSQSRRSRSTSGPTRRSSSPASRKSLHALRKRRYSGAAWPARWPCFSFPESHTIASTSPAERCSGRC
jgi:predicted membrane-bound mannosyltransferase